MSRKSLFITFEGLEGSGKSTQIKLLRGFLTKNEIRVKTLRDPGSTIIGEKIREILLNRKHTRMAPYTELLLYLAARTQMIEEKAKKAFREFDVVICDRFYDSTIVYQGYAAGININFIKAITKKFAYNIKPNLTFFLDAAPKTALARIKEKDRIESKPLSFHDKLRRGYLKLAEFEPKRIKVIPSLSKQEAHKIIKQEFLRKWEKR